MAHKRFPGWVLSPICVTSIWVRSVKVLCINVVITTNQRFFCRENHNIRALRIKVLKMLLREEVHPVDWKWMMK